MGERTLTCDVCGVQFVEKHTGKGKHAKYCHDCAKQLHRGFYSSSLRFSGQKYKNTAERLEAIKKKYSGGVTENILSEWIG